MTRPHYTRDDDESERDFAERMADYRGDELRQLRREWKDEIVDAEREYRAACERMDAGAGVGS